MAAGSGTTFAPKARLRAMSTTWFAADRFQVTDRIEPEHGGPLPENFDPNVVINLQRLVKTREPVMFQPAFDVDDHGPPDLGIFDQEICQIASRGYSSQAVASLMQIGRTRAGSDRGKTQQKVSECFALAKVKDTSR